MKNKLAQLLFLGITIATFSSCAASRSRYGCPVNAQVAPSNPAVVYTK